MACYGGKTVINYSVETFNFKIMKAMWCLPMSLSWLVLIPESAWQCWVYSQNCNDNYAVLLNLRCKMPFL